MEAYLLCHNTERHKVNCYGIDLGTSKVPPISNQSIWTNESTVSGVIWTNESAPLYHQVRVSYTPDLDWQEGWQAADILAQHWAHLDRTQDIVRKRELYLPHDWKIS